MNLKINLSGVKKYLKDKKNAFNLFKATIGIGAVLSTAGCANQELSYSDVLESSSISTSVDNVTSTSNNMTSSTTTQSKFNVNKETQTRVIDTTGENELVNIDFEDIVVSTSVEETNDVFSTSSSSIQNSSKVNIPSDILNPPLKKDNNNLIDDNVAIVTTRANTTTKEMAKTTTVPLTTTTVKPTTTTKTTTTVKTTKATTTTKTTTTVKPTTTTKTTTTVKPTTTTIETTTELVTEPPYNPEDYRKENITSDPYAFVTFASKLRYAISNGCGFYHEDGSLSFGVSESHVALYILNQGEGFTDDVIQRCFGDMTEADLEYGKEFVYRIDEFQKFIGGHIDYKDYIINETYGDYINGLRDAYDAGTARDYVAEYWNSGEFIGVYDTFAATYGLAAACESDYYATDVALNRIRTVLGFGTDENVYTK